MKLYLHWIILCSQNIGKYDYAPLVITHCYLTIKNFLKIIYWHKGKVVESATYEELVVLDERFAETAKRQIV